MFRSLWQDEAGVILSAELVLVATITVLAMVVGLSEVAIGVNEELNDISNAFGSLNQSYSYVGFRSEDEDLNKLKSFAAGSRFQDQTDSCDTNVTVINCQNPVGEGGNNSNL